MSSDLKYHSWDFKAWNQDTDVANMDLEARGAYFCLLSFQMNDGHIPNDIESILNLLGKKSPTLKYFKKNVWPQIEKKWTVVEGSPDKLYNVKLAKSMEADFAKLEANKARGKLGAQKAAENRIKTTSLEEALIPTSSFDIESVLKEYPKRDFDPSWEDGVDLLYRDITTPEIFERFKMAVSSYSKTQKKKGKEFSYKLENFANGIWGNFVPKTFRYKAVEQNIDKEKSKKVVLSEGESWPWENATLEVEKVWAAKFWTEARKQAYMNGEDHTKVVG